MEKRKSRKRSSSGGSAATLGRVAELAGVSKMTVSRVLRGDGSFSKIARERVMQAVRQTGYVPNRLAGSLASASSTLVAVIVPTISNIVFTEVLSGISSALDPSGLQAVLGVTDYDNDRENKLVETMLSWRPCAIIVAGVEHPPETTARLRAAGIPVVEIMDTDGDVIDLGVGLSHTEAGAAMGAHFVAKGYRRIAYAGTDLTRDIRAAKRLAGFRRELSAAGIALCGEHYTELPTSLFAGKESLVALMESVPDVDAIYFSNDDMAVGAALHCLREGIDMPGEIAIAGFNGLDLGNLLPRRLTTVSSPRHEIGRLAAGLVLDRLAGNNEKTRINTGFQLIVGDTA